MSRRILVVAGIAASLASASAARADDIIIDDFTVGTFASDTDENGNGTGGSWLQNLDTAHVLSGERRTLVGRVGSGSSPVEVSVANSVYEIDARSSGYGASFSLGYGATASIGQTMFLPFAMNADFSSVEALVIDIQTLSTTNTVELWVFLSTNARQHPTISSAVEGETAEVVLNLTAMPSGGLLVLDREDFVDLDATPANWADVDGILFQTLSGGHIGTNGRLIIRDVYATVPEPGSIALVLGLAACLALRRRGVAAV